MRAVEAVSGNVAIYISCCMYTKSGEFPFQALRQSTFCVYRQRMPAGWSTEPGMTSVVRGLSSLSFLLTLSG